LKAIDVEYQALIIKSRSDHCPEDQIKHYQEMVGCLMWLATISRPDLAYAASKLAQHNANPSVEAIAACKHVYRYLKGTTANGITYHNTGGDLIGHSDSNWGDSDPVDKRSTTGYCFTLAGAPISWASRRQRTTATSSTEAEYIAQCSAVKEAVYLRQFLSELQQPISVPTSIFADNMGAIALAKNPVQHSRSRHIDFQYHYTREKVEDGTVSISYVPTTQMIADGLTKPLSGTAFERFRSQIGLASINN